MPNWHRIGTNCVRTNPPIVSVRTNFFWRDVVRVVFVRQFVHLTTHFFSATGVKHVLAELLVSDEDRVESGGSRFSESILERWHYAIVSR